MKLEDYRDQIIGAQAGSGIPGGNIIGPGSIHPYNPAIFPMTEARQDPFGNAKRAHITIITAENGKIVQLGGKLYVVPEGGNVTETITAALVAQQLT